MDNLRELKLLKLKSAIQLLTQLLESQIPFRIVVINEGVKYTPSLPSTIGKELEKQEIVVFELVNYTLASGEVEGKTLRFEAGFGLQNVGAIVEVPIWKITTIAILSPELSIFINPFSEELSPSNFTFNKNRIVLK